MVLMTPSPVYTKDALSTTINIQLGAAASQTMTLTLKSWVPSVTNDVEALNADGYITQMVLVKQIRL